MAGSANNIIIAPSNIAWKIEALHQISMVADVADSLDGKYFTLMGTHYVWFDGVLAVDPAPAGLIAIPIAYTTGDSASVLAGLVQAAIDALAGFSASVSSNEVTVKAAAVGEVSDTADVDAGVSVTICLKGKNFDLGLTDGNSEISFSPDLEPITAQQTGSTKISSIVKGFEAEVSTPLKESVKSKLKEIYKIYGGVITPGAGTEVIGIGSSSLGKNLMVEAGRLVFTPVNTISDDLSYTVTLMLAIPNPESLVLSGEETRTLNVTWEAYIDQNIVNKEANFLVIGDAFQAGL
jgi:hypothetical protein